MTSFLRLQVIYLIQSCSDEVVLANRAVAYSPRVKSRDDRRFEIVRRRNPSRFDFGLLRVLPVIIRRNEGAVAGVK